MLMHRNARFRCSPQPQLSPTVSLARGRRSVVRSSSDFNAFVDFITTTQQSILREAEEIDGSGRRFHDDRFDRPGGPDAGYGITSVLEDGTVLEKAAVNISVIRGTLSAARAQSMSSRGRDVIDPAGGQAYSAAALSLVFHTASPLVPVLRADVRLFQVGGLTWYGGGCDLTPYYLNDEDAVAFHRHWKGVCEAHGGPEAYPQFKSWCDRYFYIPARKEHRGVGGIFFDDLEASEQPYDVAAFVRQVGTNILPSWRDIVAARRGTPFTPEQRQWQLLRRGRYLEFNLLYDRGVRFGLDGGRVESIMVSAPPLIAWRYNVQPAPGSPEERLVQVLAQPRDWAA